MKKSNIGSVILFKMDYRYSYLLMGLVFFVIWMILFLWRKDTRKEILIMSIIFGIGGPLGDILYTKDWWNPLTITNTKIGFEAIFVGFMIGGIAAVIYEDIFKKKIKIRKKIRKIKRKENINLLLMLSLAFLLFFESFYLLNLNSLLSTVVALVVPTMIIYILRRDLIIDSLATGFLLVIVAIIVYSVVEIFTPGRIVSFWHFKNVPNIVIFNLPLDDIILYFFSGLFICSLYGYWQEGRLSKSNK